MLAALVLSALLHPDSESSSVLHVEGRTARWEHVVQVASLTGALPGVDANFDGQLDEHELTEHRAQLARYLDEHWRALVDDAATTAVLEALATGPEPGLVTARRRLLANRPLDRFTLVVDPFGEEDPWHRSLVEVVFEDEAPIAVAFGAGVLRREVARLGVRRRATLRSFAERGARRALVEPLALGALAALLLAGASARSTFGWFLGGAAVGAGAIAAGVMAPLPFTPLFLAGTVVLFVLERALAKHLAPRTWVAGAVAVLAVLVLDASLAPFPVASAVRTSARLGLLGAWSLTTMAGALAVARLCGGRWRERAVLLVTLAAGLHAFLHASGWLGT